MTDREPIESENYDPSKELEVVKTEILGLVRGAEFGTPTYLACCDKLRSEELYGELLSGRNEVDTPVVSQASRIHRESSLRVLEQEAGFLNFQIANRRAEVKGYARAFETYNDLTERFYESLTNKLIDGSPQLSETDRTIQWEKARKDLNNTVHQILDDKAK